jgi:hypothetical protein
VVSAEYTRRWNSKARCGTVLQDPEIMKPEMGKAAGASYLADQRIIPSEVVTDRVKRPARTAAYNTA